MQSLTRIKLRHQVRVYNLNGEQRNKPEGVITSHLTPWKRALQVYVVMTKKQARVLSMQVYPSPLPTHTPHHHPTRSQLCHNVTLL